MLNSWMDRNTTLLLFSIITGELIHIYSSGESIFSINLDAGCFPCWDMIDKSGRK